MIRNCNSLDKEFPAFCLTTKAGDETVRICTDHYINDPKDHGMAIAAAEVEGEYYGKLTRAEEIMIFVNKMGYKKVGVATCIGLINECQIFTKAAKAKGIDIYSVACKVGAVDKATIGISEELKLSPGAHESMCNPVLQAELLNREGTDFNIIIGLCVGHDTLFIKHSKAPVSYLVVKDRVLCHNPVAALYNATSYYSRLLTSDLPDPRKMTK
jgi:uncharacterized metal-binding protein